MNEFTILYFICVIILIYDSWSLGVIKAQLDNIEELLEDK